MRFFIVVSLRLRFQELICSKLKNTAIHTLASYNSRFCHQAGCVEDRTREDNQIHCVRQGREPHIFGESCSDYGCKKCPTKFVKVDQKVIPTERNLQL